MNNAFVRKSVGAYKVLVSANPLFPRRLAAAVKTSTDMLAEVGSDKYTTIFSSDVAGFLELTHDFKFQSQKNNLGPTITIKTYEPGLEFLNNLFFDFVERSLSKLADSGELEQKRLKGYLESLSVNKHDRAVQLEEIAGLSENRDDLKRDLDSLGLGFPSFRSASVAEVQEIRAKIEEARRKIEAGEKSVAEFDKEISFLNEDVATIVSHRSLPKVYVMYGVGNDLNHWAGPFEVYLGDIKYSNNGKEEIVDYIFSLDINHLQFEDSTIRSPREWTTFFQNAGIPIDAYNWDKYTWVRKGFTNPNYTFHDCIVKLISSYLFQLGIKNHLVVLPYLDSLMSANIEQVILDRVGNFMSHYPDNEEFDFSKLVEEWEYLNKYTGIDRQSRIFTLVASLFNFDPGAFPAAGTDPFLVRAGIDSGFNVLMRNDLINTVRGIVRDILSSIGAANGTANVPSSEVDGALDVVQKHASGVGEARIGLVDPTPDEEEESEVEHGEAVVSSVSVNNPFHLIGPSRSGTVEAHNIGFLNLGNEYVWGKNASVDWSEPIRDIIDGLNSVASNRYIQYEAAFIHNKDIVDMITDKWGGGTFVGYATSPGAPKIDDTPYFIVGDRDLINSLVYGDLSRAVEKNPGIEAFDTLAESFDFPVGVVDIGVFSLRDPFWSVIHDDLSLSRDAIVGASYFSKAYNLVNSIGKGLNLGYHLGIVSAGTGLATEIPDEFGYFKDDKLLGDMFDMNLPIFLGNTDNANILSYSFDANKFLYSNLYGSIQDIYFQVATRFLRKDNPIIGGSLDPDEVLGKIMEIMDIVRAKRLFAGKGMTASLGIKTTVDLEEIYDNLAKVILSDTKGIGRRVRKNKGSSILTFVMLFMDIFEREYLGSIKTLPMFHISTHSYITGTALALIKNTRRVTPHRHFREERTIGDFFTGMYRLLGFRHTITNSDAYSEFTMQKDIVGELNNE